MIKQKKSYPIILSILLAFCLTGGLAACSQGTEASVAASKTSSQTTEENSTKPSSQATVPESTENSIVESESTKHTGEPLVSEVIWLTGNVHYYSNKDCEFIVTTLSDNTYRLIDYSGNLIGEYDDFIVYGEGLVKVKKDGKFGFIDGKGSVVIPLVYDGLSPFSESLAGVSKDGEWGYIDITGRMVISLEYYCDDLTPFSQGLAGVKKDGKWGMIDTTGRIVVPLEYDNHFYYHEGLAVVSKDGKYGLIDTEGRIIVPLEYDYISDNSTFLKKIYVSGIRKDGKWGFIDTTGHIVSLEYENRWEFNEGLAVVKKNGKWGLIDTTKSIVIPLEYDSVAVNKRFEDTPSDGVDEIWSTGDISDPSGIYIVIVKKGVSYGFCTITYP